MIVNLLALSFVKIFVCPFFQFQLKKFSKSRDVGIFFQTIYEIGICRIIYLFFYFFMLCQSIYT